MISVETVKLKVGLGGVERALRIDFKGKDFVPPEDLKQLFPTFNDRDRWIETNDLGRRTFLDFLDNTAIYESCLAWQVRRLFGKANALLILSPLNEVDLRDLEGILTSHVNRRGASPALEIVGLRELMQEQTRVAAS